MYVPAGAVPAGASVIILAHQLAVIVLPSNTALCMVLLGEYSASVPAPAGYSIHKYTIRGFVPFQQWTHGLVIMFFPTIYHGRIDLL